MNTYVSIFLSGCRSNIAVRQHRLTALRMWLSSGTKSPELNLGHGCVYPKISGKLTSPVSSTIGTRLAPYVGIMLGIP